MGVSSAHYSSSFILTTITDQPIVVIVFHVLFFAMTGKTNYFESFFGAMMAMLCFYLTPELQKDKKIVLSVEYVLSVFVVFCSEYLVNVIGYPVAFFNIVIYITLFKLDHLYMNVYCIMTLIQVLVTKYLMEEKQVLAYAGLSTIVALGVFVWNNKKKK